MNSDLWPGSHSVPCCGGWEGRLCGDFREAPLSTHSQCFIYGPLHFWLWWLQYLSSYLNCIFKDFIQYLHAIRYELIFFLCQPFLFVSYLIVFILAWFVTIIHKQTCPLDQFSAENVMGDIPCMFLCVMILMTAEHQEAGVGKYLLDELNFDITLCFQ